MRKQENRKRGNVRSVSIEEYKHLRGIDFGKQIRNLIPSSIDSTISRIPGWESKYFTEMKRIIYEEEKCYYVTFSTGDFEIINKINDIYNNKYLMIVKDILRGRNWDYTKFEVVDTENLTESKILKGGEYKEKFRLLCSAPCPGYVCCSRRRRASSPATRRG